MIRLGLLAVLAFVLATPTFAQFDLNGPNARQLVMGVEGAVVDPIDHDVGVILPGTFRLKIESGINANMPVATIMSPLQPTPGVLNTPWGGTIDIGTWDPTTVLANTTVLGDAITFSGNPYLDPFFVTGTMNPFTGAPPSLEITASFGASAIPSGLSVLTRAFQSIVYDPTAAPLNLDNTEATDANFMRGQSGVLRTGDDGFVTVPFIGGTFEFHGQSYSSVTVCANGFVTFGGPPTLANMGADGDHLAWVNDRPSIAVLLADWDPSAASANDGVWYEEAGGFVTIAWGDPRASSAGGIAHAGDVDANFFRLTLALDDGANPMKNGFVIEHVLLDPAAGALAGNGLVGHTPGGATLVSGAFDVALAGAPLTVDANVAQIEEHDAAGINVANLGYDGAGSLRCVNDVIARWQGSYISFSPRHGYAVAGDRGYASLPQWAPADQLTGIAAPAIAAAGGQIITVCGSFLGFDPQGTGPASVVLDPNGVQGGPFTATPLGILDSIFASGPLSRPNPQPGPHRDGQALRILTPAMSGIGGTTDLRVVFASGATLDVPVTIGSTPPVTTVYTLNDDDAVLHALTQPIHFYGQSWSSFWVGSNGYVTFGHGSTDNFGGIATVESGFGQVGTPSVSALFTDLNAFGTTSGATYVVKEDLAQGIVEVAFTNMYYWATLEWGGTVRIRFGKQGPGSVEIDYANFIPAVAGSAPVTIGVSDGDPATPYTNFSNGQGSGMYLATLAGGGTGYLSPSGGHSLVETFFQNTAVPFTKLVFEDLAVSPPFGLWRLH